MCPVPLAVAVPVFLLVCVHENVVLWAGYHRYHSGRIVGVALSGFGILNSCFLRLSFFDVVGFQRFSRCAISPRGVLRWTMREGASGACGSWAVVHHVHLHRGRGIESGFEMAMFFPFKGSKGSEGSKCLYSFESFLKEGLYS